MITAKNYAAQVEKYCREYGEHYLKKGMAVDAKSVFSLGVAISTAQHFVIPDGGVIFNDNLKGAAGLSLRMPYEIVTIEYYMPPDGRPLEDNEIGSSKRMILCIDTECLVRDDQLPPTERGVIIIPFWDGSHTKNGWGFSGIGIIVPRQWDNVYAAEIDLTGNLKEKWDNSFVGRTITFLPQTEELLRKKIGEERFRELKLRGIDDVGSEVRAVLEFFEALSCSNVTATPIEKVDPAKNARRIRDGKLPLYETKVLTVDCPSARYPSQSTSEPSNRASPREHLRRGHIRRLENGNRIWVNAAVIGSAGMGRIDKRYKIRSAA